MIEIIDKITQNTYYFPKSGSEMPSTLRLYSELTHAKHTFDVSGCGASSMYYTISLSFEEVADGEYKYTLENADGRVIEGGEMRVGEIKDGNVVYQYGETFETYDPETGESEDVPYSDCTKEVEKAYEEGKEEVREEVRESIQAINPIKGNGTYMIGDVEEIVIDVEGGGDAKIYPNLEVTPFYHGKDSTDIFNTPEGYDGMAKVTVHTNKIYEGAFNDGKFEGAVANQEAIENKIKEISPIQSNGTYQLLPDGYEKLVIDIPQSERDYQEGIIEGEKRMVENIAGDFNAISPLTENKRYEVKELIDGQYHSIYVDVDVPQSGGDYDQGFEDGEAAQKAKLTTLNVYDSGTYTREDGFKKVVVNVLKTLYVKDFPSDIPFLDGYDALVVFDGDYFDCDTYDDGWTIGDYIDGYATDEEPYYHYSWSVTRYTWKTSGRHYLWLKSRAIEKVSSSGESWGLSKNGKYGTSAKIYDVYIFEATSNIGDAAIYGADNVYIYNGNEDLRISFVYYEDEYKREGFQDVYPMGDRIYNTHIYVTPNYTYDALKAQLRYGTLIPFNNTAEAVLPTHYVKINDVGRVPFEDIIIDGDCAIEFEVLIPNAIAKGIIDSPTVNTFVLDYYPNDNSFRIFDGSIYGGINLPFDRSQTNTNVLRFKFEWKGGMFTATYITADGYTNSVSRSYTPYMDFALCFGGVGSSGGNVNGTIYSYLKVTDNNNNTTHLIAYNKLRGMFEDKVTKKTYPIIGTHEVIGF